MQMSTSIMQLSLRQGSYYKFSSNNVDNVTINMVTLLTGLNTALTKEGCSFYKPDTYKISWQKCSLIYSDHSLIYSDPKHFK